ncbi:hypothetical protein [Bdellovibrio svalbardensis]|uniref:Uncharacterized protein n=1 Tax=Bdellovibrio svalbardensis TaxID=2972972 RepID=A0ABT6DJ23_9BACT|nr:hypothetical protein [Bdellovibrio svalbardensis]MDG0816512.1 hypothetical protein [Bdellovibrio svalbardensis]
MSGFSKVFVLAIGMVCSSSFASIKSNSSTEKYCGKLRSDFKYIYDESSEDAQKSRVELCLDIVDHGVQCGVSSDPLLMSSLNVLLSQKVSEICMKFDDSTNPRTIVGVEGR